MHPGVSSSQAFCPHSPPKCGPVLFDHCPGLPLWSHVTDNCHWFSFCSHTGLSATCSHQLNVIIKFFLLFWTNDLSYWVHFPFPTSPKYKSFLSQFPVPSIQPIRTVPCSWKPPSSWGYKSFPWGKAATTPGTKRELRNPRVLSFHSKILIDFSPQRQ